MKALPTILIAIFFGLLADDAFGYIYSYCNSSGNKIKWSGTSKTLRPNSTSFPAGYWENGIRNTIDVFNKNPSRFRYWVSMETGSVGRGNGQSEIWADSDLCGDDPACAYTRQYCYWLFGWHYGIKELDIVYGTNTAWTASTSKDALIRYKGSGRSLQSTGAHELGHGLILSHVNTEYNVMGTDFEHMHANGNTVRAYIGEDVADGMVFLYGNRGGWQDVSVTHWKYSGAFEEYSDHTKTVIRNSNGGPLATANVNGEVGYRVARGQRVQVEFTFENNGSDTQVNIPVGYYISTNDRITTWDRRVASRTINLSRDNVATFSTLVEIPTDLQLNRNYWVGVIIDYKDRISEAVEYNNATYTPIFVQ